MQRDLCRSSSLWKAPKPRPYAAPTAPLLSLSIVPPYTASCCEMPGVHSAQTGCYCVGVLPNRTRPFDFTTRRSAKAKSLTGRCRREQRVRSVVSCGSLCCRTRKQHAPNRTVEKCEVKQQASAAKGPSNTRERDATLELLTFCAACCVRLLFVAPSKKTNAVEPASSRITAGTRRWCAQDAL